METYNVVNTNDMRATNDERMCAALSIVALTHTHESISYTITRFFSISISVV